MSFGSGNSGGGSINGASDVVLDSVQTGQVLSFNGTDRKWVNKNITAAGSSLLSNTRTPLLRFHALAGKRYTQPVYVACCGDSWTFGTGSSGNTAAWTGRLSSRLQSYYPLPDGSTSAVCYINNPGGSGIKGVRVIGNGHSGATTASYLPQQEIIDLMAMQPAMVIHAIGLNDQAQSFTKATYKSNLLSTVNAIKYNASAPVIQLLVRNPELKRTNTYPWTDYGDAMKEIVATDPSTLMYVDLAPSFEQAQIKNGDPLGLLTADGGHPVDVGHSLIAELLFAAIRPELALG